MKPSGYFVTGTDTGVGKTLVGRGLILALRRQGLRVAGMKPVASGCEPTPEGLRNEDALALAAVSSLELPYASVNPYAFAPPIAPHIAAAEAGIAIDPERILEHYRAIAAQVDAVVVEGVGGWLVPIDPQRTMADLAAMLGLPVVLVVAVRLGCLNHALLTAESILGRGLELAGWVANLSGPGEVRPEEMRLEENIAALTAGVPAPCLGRLPRLAGADAEEVADRLSPG